LVGHSTRSAVVWRFRGARCVAASSLTEPCRGSTWKPRIPSSPETGAKQATRSDAGHTTGVSDVTGVTASLRTKSSGRWAASLPGTWMCSDMQGCPSPAALQASFWPPSGLLLEMARPGQRWEEPTLPWERLFPDLPALASDPRDMHPRAVSMPNEAHSQPTWSDGFSSARPHQQMTCFGNIPLVISPRPGWLVMSGLLTWGVVGAGAKEPASR
jgi:hypothetical protein